MSAYIRRLSVVSCRNGFFIILPGKRALDWQYSMGANLRTPLFVVAPCNQPATNSILKARSTRRPVPPSVKYSPNRACYFSMLGRYLLT